MAMLIKIQVIYFNYWVLYKALDGNFAFYSLIAQLMEIWGCKQCCAEHLVMSAREPGPEDSCPVAQWETIRWQGSPSPTFLALASSSPNCSTETVPTSLHAYYQVVLSDDHSLPFLFILPYLLVSLDIFSHVCGLFRFSHLMIYLPDDILTSFLLDDLYFSYWFTAVCEIFQILNCFCCFMS